MTRVSLLIVLFATACGTDSVHLGGERRVDPDASDGGDDDGGSGSGNNGGPGGGGHNGDNRTDNCDRRVCGYDKRRDSYGWYRCLDDLKAQRGVEWVDDGYCR
jgi:hypothetical protein